MATIKVYNMKAEETGVMEVSDALFQMDYNEALIHQAVVTRLAHERQGTKSTLTRTEVRGGGRNRSDRKAQVMLVRVLSERLSSSRAA